MTPQKPGACLPRERLGDARRGGLTFLMIIFPTGASPRAWPHRVRGRTWEVRGGRSRGSFCRGLWDQRAGRGTDMAHRHGRVVICEQGLRGARGEFRHREEPVGVWAVSVGDPCRCAQGEADSATALPVALCVSARVSGGLVGDGSRPLPPAPPGPGQGWASQAWGQWGGGNGRDDSLTAMLLPQSPATSRPSSSQ